MKRIFKTAAFLLLCLIAGSFTASAGTSAKEDWKDSRWITKTFDTKGGFNNNWIAFRKKVSVKEVPSELIACIAADSKYWMWINGKAIVYDGGLKRGPAPGDGYYDRIDIAPFLEKGDNVIAVLLWHFGQNGFSHMDSGMAALRFEARCPGLEILSNRDWESTVLPNYSSSINPPTNYRLPEESIIYDARAYTGEWIYGDKPKRIGGAMEIPGHVADVALGRLVERPIPMFRFSELRPYESVERRADTLVCKLPYNGHFHPYLKVKAASGDRIEMRSDHDRVGGLKCVHAEYICRDGEQEYESLCWISGEWMYYIMPQGVEVIDLKYRESGYDTSIEGHFVCDDTLFNEYWNKAARTLLVCMRDTWYDCPDRERAQWWGDEVNELNSAFYSLSLSSADLAKKGIYELCNWHQEDGSLYAPVPSGIYFNELPMQTLASVGWYGFRGYSFYRDDDSFIADIYPVLHRYLHETWQLDDNGLPVYRKGGWDWADAGHNKDKAALLPHWYMLALKAEAEFARKLGLEEDAHANERAMDRIKESYNRIFWTGSEYRSPDYKELTDDRVQAMAVLSGIAGEDRYDALTDVLAREAHATTYMFGYVLEALVRMGRTDMAQDRMRRFYPSIMKPDCSTLYEHWNFEGTSNHAWSGTGIVIMGKFFAGIDAIEPGFKVFSLRPHMGSLKHIDCAVPTAYGNIELKLDRNGRKIKAMIVVPEGCEARLTDYRGRELSLGEGLHEITMKDNK